MTLVGPYNDVTVLIEHLLKPTISGAVYVSTEDVFPSKRLCQLAEQFTSRTHHSSIKHFTDKVFIEHAASVVIIPQSVATLIIYHIYTVSS